MIRSGFHYTYESPNDVNIMFYDEVTDKDYLICNVDNLSIGNEIVRCLQDAYGRVYMREGGIK